jgi:hypothetical protein
MGKPGKLRKSKKELFHALRYLDFGLQVILLHDKKIDKIGMNSITTSFLSA